MPFIRIVLYSFLISSILPNNPSGDSLFISPLKIPVNFSSNFGELRVDHFHSGLDLRTQGVEGKVVVASADGYVYRVSVSPGGFGNALYLRHASGYSTVYGHLSKFIPEIEEYVTNQQYEQKSFLITVYPEKEKFAVKQGDTIGYSGNSGSSGGPHLHYEIRKSANEAPVNPLLFNFDVDDNIKPVIDRLSIYPINQYSVVENQNKPRFLTVSGGNGNYFIAPENEVAVSGEIGFGIKTYDFLKEGWTRTNVYSIELLIDSIPYFKYTMNDFPFNEARNVNSHVDYSTWITNNTTFERTFVLPNDKLDTYSELKNRGIYNFSDGKTHQIEIKVSDVQKNQSVLFFNLKSVKPADKKYRAVIDTSSVLMPYNKSNKFTSDNISITFPSGSLYDTLHFEYSVSKRPDKFLSDIHHIHNNLTPIQTTYNVSIKPSVIPAGKESKLIIVQTDGELKQSYAGGKFVNGYVVADLSTLGDFAVGIDTIKPEIKVPFASGADYSGKSEIKITITDSLSGIKSYSGYIDGNWALFKYDSKYDLLTYSFDGKRITKGILHKLVIKVTDGKDNISTKETNFKW